jgi:hypothetical protein
VIEDAPGCRTKQETSLNVSVSGEIATVQIPPGHPRALLIIQEER